MPEYRLQPPDALPRNVEALKSAQKVLFMTHLALGDYVYQRQFLRLLKTQYPQLSLDIWIDDCRIRHKNWHAGRNQTLCQWLSEEPYYNNIYPIVANSKERSSLITQARNEDYDFVFFIAMNRGARFAKIARLIAPQAKVVGALSSDFNNPISKRFTLNRLDSFIQVEDDNNLPIKSRYAQYFSTCLGVKTDSIAENELDIIDIPQRFIDSAVKVVSEAKPSSSWKTLLINHLSTNEKRDFSWQQTRELLCEVASAKPTTNFFLNVPPDQLGSIERKVASDEKLNTLQIKVFSAQQHFFELPALISACDFVVSVETAVMHLSAALRKPQLILMRDNAKQWQPPGAHNVLFGTKRVDQIAVDEVVSSVLQQLS